MNLDINAVEELIRTNKIVEAVEKTTGKLK